MSITEQDRARVRAVKEHVEDHLLRLPGVTGVDIDEKMMAGQPTGVAALVVFVAHKLPRDEVPPAEFIPTQIEGVPTDVRELRISPQTAPS